MRVGTIFRGIESYRFSFTYTNGFCRILLVTNPPLTEEVVGHKLQRSRPSAIILKLPPWLDPPGALVCRLRVSDTRDPFPQLNVNLTFKYFPCFIYLLRYSTPGWPNFSGQGIPRRGQAIPYRQNAFHQLIYILSTILIDNHTIPVIILLSKCAIVCGPWEYNHGMHKPCVGRLIFRLSSCIS